MTRVLLALAVVAAVAAAALPAEATAPPVGPLPAAQVTRVSVAVGARVAVAVPSRAGYDWRIARTPDPRVLRQSGEANVGSDVVLVFRTLRRGHTSVTVAQTRGERPKAYRAVRYDVAVR
jgi:hypothetical protein